MSKFPKKYPHGISPKLLKNSPEYRRNSYDSGGISPEFQS
jgi:hypothetical protein